MKKITGILISSLLLLGTVACNNAAKTSEEAPPTTNQSAEAPKTDEAQDINKDAASETRRRQLDADIRAREQRNQMAGGDANRSDADLSSEVRSKLEANLPASQLAVETEEGAVTVSGTVPTQAQFNRIEPLAREIYGVKDVTVKAVVAPAKQDTSSKPASKQ